MELIIAILPGQFNYIKKYQKVHTCNSNYKMTQKTHRDSVNGHIFFNDLKKISLGVFPIYCLFLLNHYR